MYFFTNVSLSFLFDSLTSLRFCLLSVHCFLDALFSCVCLYIIINNLLQLGVLEALKLDRTPIEGRPMFVSKCEDRSQKKAQFKVGKCVMTRAFIMMIKSTL